MVQTCRGINVHVVNTDSYMLGAWDLLQCLWIA